jgi:hypothetical protein
MTRISESIANHTIAIISTPCPSGLGIIPSDRSPVLTIQAAGLFNLGDRLFQGHVSQNRIVIADIVSRQNSPPQS